MYHVPYTVVTKGDETYHGTMEMNIINSNPTQLYVALSKIFSDARDKTGFIFIKDNENGKVHAINIDNILRFSLGKKPFCDKT